MDPRQAEPTLGDLLTTAGGCAEADAEERASRRPDVYAEADAEERRSSAEHRAVPSLSAQAEPQYVRFRGDHDRVSQYEDPDADPDATDHVYVGFSPQPTEGEGGTSYARSSGGHPRAHARPQADEGGSPYATISEVLPLPPRPAKTDGPKLQVPTLPISPKPTGLSPYPVSGQSSFRSPGPRPPALITPTATATATPAALADLPMEAKLLELTLREAKGKAARKRMAGSPSDDRPALMAVDSVLVNKNRLSANLDGAGPRRAPASMVPVNPDDVLDISKLGTLVGPAGRNFELTSKSQRNKWSIPMEDTKH